MLIGLENQECIRSISPEIADTLEQFAAQVNAGFAVGHNPNGTNIVLPGTTETAQASVHIYLGGSRYHGVQVT